MEVLSRLLKTSLFAVLLLVVFQAEAQEDRKLVTFVIRNAGIGVDGHFKNYSVTTKFNPNDLANSSLSATIEANTISTGIRARDKHLRKKKYFDVENYPEIKLTSTEITKTDTGYLLKKTTRSVEIPFTVITTDAGTTFEGEFSLDRRDYGVGKNHLVLGDKVKVKIYHWEKSGE
jgi:polyisoprenoid-binding protein YceI